MPNAFKYQLEKGSKKHICPRCHKRRFVRYIDCDNGAYAESQFGRCDREVNCGYHLNPYQEGSLTLTDQPHSCNPRTSLKPPSTISWDIVNRTIDKPSALLEFLLSHFEKESVNSAAEFYHLGTSKKWPGATIYWQIDSHSKVRTGKIMLYGQDGKRVKEPYNHIAWVHTELKLKDFNLVQCFFGEHLLLRFPQKTAAIVESEKTAVIGSICFPQFVWLASGSKNLHQLNSAYSCTLFQNRHVVLFPDLGAFSDWKRTEAKLQSKSVRTFDLMEEHATEAERNAGWDVADYLIRLRNNRTEPENDGETIWLGMSSAEVIDALGGVQFP